MEYTMLRKMLALTLAFTLLSVLAAHAADDEAARTKEGLDAFQAYAKKEYPDKKWQRGPLRLDSPELRTAYPNQRVYVVYSSPPLPPGGARTSPAQEAYRRQIEDVRQNYVSLTARIDEKGQIVPLRTPQDYNGGLAKVASDETARTAAAAILSLHRCDHVPPAAVDPNDIRVTKTETGWSCRNNGKGMFRGTVTFDAAGQCTAVSKSYSGPLRP